MDLSLTSHLSNFLVNRIPALTDRSQPVPSYFWLTKKPIRHLLTKPAHQLSSSWKASFNSLRITERLFIRSRLLSLRRWWHCKNQMALTLLIHRKWTIWYEVLGPLFTLGMLQIACRPLPDTCISMRLSSSRLLPSNSRSWIQTSCAKLFLVALHLRPVWIAGPKGIGHGCLGKHLFNFVSCSHWSRRDTSGLLKYYTCERTCSRRTQMILLILLHIGCYLSRQYCIEYGPNYGCRNYKPR